MKKLFLEIYCTFNIVKNNIIKILILFILAVGTYFISEISYLHYIKKIECTRFLIIPACYIGTVYFIFLLIFQVVQKQIIPFFIFLGAGLALSIYASIGHIYGKVICVSSSLGIPFCYIVLAIFLIITVLKFILLNNNKNYTDNVAK